jgi:hypothetical protein
VKEYWRDLYPHLAHISADVRILLVRFYNLCFAIFQSLCPPLWDGASCLPPTPTGHLAVIPCMRMNDGEYYTAGRNSSRQCMANGSWDIITDYKDCSKDSRQDSADIYLIIYAAGELCYHN